MKEPKRSLPDKKSLRRIRRTQILMVVGYALLVALTLSIVTTLVERKTDEVLKNKVISMTSSLNVQMKLNMDSYLSRMETIATLAFGAEEAYTYDATDPENDEYEAINTEKVITDKLYSLCIMENFVDYGIVYRNNRTVGKISNGTSKLFGDRIFTELSGMISRDRTNDGWFTGYENDFRRIYYVKEVHENAVLVISFYANELYEVFDNPETMSDMEIRLVNQDYNIIFSKDRDEVGENMPESIKSRIAGQNSASVMDNEYLCSVNKCGDWYVVCSIPTDIVLKEKNEMRQYIYLVGAVAAAAAALAGLYLSILLTSPVKRMVSRLDDKASIDLLTGILNKLSFEEYAEGCLRSSLDTEHRALVIIDIDDFKGVNDTYGHAAGDRVLEETGRVMRELFSQDDYLGRIGGDEFCALVNARSESTDKLRQELAGTCGRLEKVLGERTKTNGSPVSASIGVAFFPEDGRSFEELYAAADKALYRSKGSGKNTFSFYEGDEREGEQS